MKIKKQYGLIAAAFAAVLCATPRVADAALGDIRSIRFTKSASDTRTYPNMDDPLRAGDTVDITVRVINRGWSNISNDPELHNEWGVRFIGAGSEVAATNSLPIELGLRASGRLVYAPLISQTETPNRHFTDLTFRYTVKAGDLAMPLKLANGSGLDDAMGAGDNTDMYYLRCRNADDWGLFPRHASAVYASSADRLQFYWGPENLNDPTYAGEYIGWAGPNYPEGDNIDITIGRDKDLSGAGIYVKAIDFDDNYADEANGTWRNIPAGESCTDGTVAVPGGAAELSSLYVWSADDSIAKIIKGGDVTKVETKTWVVGFDGSGTPQTKTFTRGQLRVNPGVESANLVIQAAEDKVGQSTEVYLSNCPTNVFNDANNLLTNFTYRVVKITPAPDPYISVQVKKNGESDYSSLAQVQSAGSAAVASLDVTLSKSYTEDLTVTIKPELNDGTSRDVWDFIGLSTHSTDMYGSKTVTVTIPAGERRLSADISKLLWLYAKRGDDNTAKPDKGVKFSVESVQPASAMSFFTGEFQSCSVSISPRKPEILEPEAGYDYLDIPGNVEQEFTIKLDDAIGELSGEYIVVWDNVNGNPNPKNADHVVSNLTANANGEIKVGRTYVSAGIYDSTFYVINQDGAESAKRTVKVHVNAPNTVEGVPDKEVYGEGETASVIAKFAPGNYDKTAPGYVFLVPADEISSNNVECSAFETGKEVLPGKNVTYEPISIKFLDNGAYHYKLEVRSANKIGEGEKYTTWVSQDLVIVATNVCPKVDFVEMSGTPVTEGSTLQGVSLGVTKVFKWSAYEPGEKDLEVDTFKTVWSFFAPDGSMLSTVTKDGKPASAEVPYQFVRKGLNKVQVYMYDKDMDEQAITEAKKSRVFTFYVNVGDEPSVSAESYRGTTIFNENQTGTSDGRIDIRLNESCTTQLTIRATITRCGTDNGNYPFPVIKGHAGTGFTEVTDEWNNNQRVYDIPFKVGQVEEFIYLYSMDGTERTGLDGFLFKFEVITDTPSSDPTKTWAEYYQPCSDFSITIENVKPVFTGEDPTTNPVARAMNVAFPISWTVNDIMDDKTNGLKVVWATSEGAGETFTTDAASGKYCYTGTYTCTFTSAGMKTVTATVYDKDGGETTRTWYYEVSAAKNVLLYPHNPHRTPQSDFTRRYTDQSGIGAGRVWSSGSLSEITGFAHQWNYAAEESGAKIYAHGYKTGDVDNGHLTPGVDMAVTAGGSWDKTGTGVDYTYTSEYDSFFYTWIKVTGDSESGKEGVPLGAITPEQFATDNGEQAPELPEYDEETVSYPKMIFEAIFSREFRKNDNLGDINQDWIPDVYAVRSWPGVNSPAYEMAGGSLEDGGDLVDLELFNGDEDFLPSKTSQGNALIPGIASSWISLNNPFNARWEVRGFGDGLNHRADHDPESKNLYVRGQYISDPDFTLAEAFAFCKYMEEQGTTIDPPADDTPETLAQWHTDNDAAIKASDWSPENRTDITTDDTDNDKFPDGYEYYFWYFAHVGEIVKGDAGLELKQLTGSRFQLENIAQGIEITSKEIEEAFNPTKSAGSEAYLKRDFDNDGLTDIEEFVIGTSPINWDTDGDSMSDLWEVMNGLNPLVKNNDANPDGDFMAAYTTPEEYAIVTLGGKTYALPANGSGFLNDDGTALKDGITTVNAIPVYRYGNDNSQWTPCKRGVRVQDMSVSTLKNAGVKMYSNTSERKQCKVWTYQPGTLPLDAEIVEVAAEDNGAAVTVDESLFLVHDQVYATFGFDPRTGWYSDSNGYLGSRWNEIACIHAQNANGAGRAINTKPYTALDEYLLLKYRYETAGATGPMAKVNPAISTDTKYTLQADKANIASGLMTLQDVLILGTTRPNLAFDEITYGDEQQGFTMSCDIHGADTDKDGVPDGWELYVSHNPNTAAQSDTLDVDDEDGLSLAEEYAGTDSCNAYYPDGESEGGDDTGTAGSRNCETIYANHPGKKSGWYNKFFPTDPWDGDTDGDGIADSQEGSTWQATFRYCANGGSDEIAIGGHTYTFIYGEPEDDGSLCIRGGGLNPCSIDTDGDLLPDPWEMQYAGVVFKAGVPQDIKLSASIIQSLNRLDGVDASSTNSAAGYYLAGGMDATFGPRLDNLRILGDAYAEAGSLDPRTGTERNYDFDLDGLQNFQEYLVQALRHLRYDDTETPLMGRYLQYGISGEAKFVGFIPMQTWDGASFYAACKAAGFTGLSDFSLKYSKLGYFARPPRAWDKAALDSKGMMLCINYKENGYRYMLRPETLTSAATAALEDRLMSKGYCTTDPREWDTDGDGMDDFWELFHGLNPILGDTTIGTCRDIISENYAMIAGSGVFSAYNNAWTMWDPMMSFSSTPDAHYDPLQWPWLMGNANADADGDGLRNLDEALLVNTASPANYHTDPTPLWYTDSSTLIGWRAGGRRPISFTAQYYGMDPYQDPAEGGHPDLCGYWTLNSTETGATSEFMFAFEENEGYDTDGDGLNDADEATRTVTVSTDPLDHTDPDHRQAMWFPGEESAAISAGADFQRKVGEDGFLFRQFTAECWIRPSTVGGKEQVILERACKYGGSTLSNAADVVRANFRLGIAADGRIYGMYDNDNAVASGTMPYSVFVYGTKAEVDVWSHVALSFDGSELALYVNGQKLAVERSALIPANGIVVVKQGVAPGNTGNGDGSAKFGESGYTTMPCAMIIGASGIAPDSAKVNEKSSWQNYDCFYAGWIDEVRIWDGARTAREISTDFGKRYSMADVAELRNNVWLSWAGLDGTTRPTGQPPFATRNNNDGKPTLPAELVFHYNFQNLPSEVDEGSLLWEPSGFTEKVVDNVRVDGKPVPGDIYCGWWFDTPIHSTIYSNYRLVPWIRNTVGHLPMFDGSALDSRYWSAALGGVTATNEVNVSIYDFPNSAMPYSRWYSLYEETDRNNMLATLAGNSPVRGLVMIYDRYRFEQRTRIVGGSDLVPCGGAFAKRCPDFWDGQGATDAWTATDWDGDGDSIPDWWEELYANKIADAGVTDIGPDTLVNWYYMINGNTKGPLVISAREAYLRDLMLGLLPTYSGALAGAALPAYDEQYKSSIDGDGDGLPDWYESIYDIASQDAEDDADGDGLSNFAEYLIGECFINYGFPRVLPNSAMSFAGDGQVVPDYFLKKGKMYLGEMFSDHDLVEDAWENQYAVPVDGYGETLYASRYVFDRFADHDNDGWSNWAECRADTDPTKQNAAGLEGLAMPEHPVPEVKAKIVLRTEGTLDAPIIVKAYSQLKSENSLPDAIWKVGSGTETTRYVGFNPNRSVDFKLGPGNIEPGSIKVNFRTSIWYDYSNESGVIHHLADCEWIAPVHDAPDIGDISTGVLFGYGSTDWVVGRVNYATGEITVDFTKLQEDYRTTGEGGSTDSYRLYPLANGYVNISWKSVVPNGNREIVLSLNQPLDAEVGVSEGNLREGLNTFEVFLDLNGDGAWTAGEPYGVVNSVDVGYAKGECTVELTDVAPQTMRIKLAEAMVANDFESQKSLTDRGVKNELAAGTNQRLEEDYIGENMPTVSTEVRVRLVRTAVNGVMSNGKTYASGAAYDAVHDFGRRPDFTELDILRAGKPDLDWSSVVSTGTSLGIANVTSILYRVVLGDGDISTLTLSNNNSLATMFVNRFETGSAQSLCTPVSPVGTVYSAQPTFRWTQSNTIGKDYPAFRLRVWSGKDVVYDSGVKRAPARDKDGVYTWAAPLYVDMLTPEGVLFANTNNYSWSVSMLDAKFTSVNANESHRSFRVEASGQLGTVSDYGTITAKVKYFGPAKVSNKALDSLIRVQAFSTPDFSGVPLGEATVKSTSGLATSDSLDGSVAVLRGLPVGTYYLRAYIDTDGNGKCDSTESQGYCCYVGDPYAPFVQVVRGSGVEAKTVRASEFMYTPKALVLAKGQPSPDATIYIEDMDTDNDGLPDVWEIENKSSLNGVTSPSGGTFFTKVNPDLATSIKAYVNLTDDGGVATKDGNVYARMTLFANLLSGSDEAALAAAMMVEDDSAAAEQVAVSIDSFSLAEGLKLSVDSKVDGAGGEIVTVADSATVGVYLVASDSPSFIGAKSDKVKDLVIKANDVTELTVSAADLKAAIEDNNLGTAGFFKVKIVAE